jgi:hypothetical protein
MPTTGALRKRQEYLRQHLRPPKILWFLSLLFKTVEMQPGVPELMRVSNGL